MLTALLILTILNTVLVTKALFPSFPAKKQAKKQDGPIANVSQFRR